MAADQQRIDELLAGVHQGLARAHFAAERGARFGQGQYDGRMRAARVLRITGEPVPVFAMRESEDAEDKEKNSEGKVAET